MIDGRAISIPMGSVSQFEKEGSYVAIPLGSPPAPIGVAVVKIGGELIAFDNRCPHRGAQLLPWGSGVSDMRCPYHGRVADKKSLLNDKWEVDVREGVVTAYEFGLHHEDIQHCPLPHDAQLHSWTIRELPYSWTVAVENALDNEHTHNVHKSSLHPLGLRRSDMSLLSDGGSYELFRASENCRSRLDMTDKMMPVKNIRVYFSGLCEDVDYIHWHIAPHACLASVRGWTYGLQIYTPCGDKSWFYHATYSTKASRSCPEFIDSAAALSARVFAEDEEVCALVPSGFPGSLGGMDDRIKHFRRYLNEKN